MPLTVVTAQNNYDAMNR